MNESDPDSPANSATNNANPIPTGRERCPCSFPRVQGSWPARHMPSVTCGCQPVSSSNTLLPPPLFSLPFPPYPYPSRPPTFQHDKIPKQQSKEKKKSSTLTTV